VPLVRFLSRPLAFSQHFCREIFRSPSQPSGRIRSSGCAGLAVVTSSSSAPKRKSARVKLHAAERQEAREKKLGTLAATGFSRFRDDFVAKVLTHGALDSLAARAS